MAAMAYDWLENWYSLKFATPEQLNGRKTKTELPFSKQFINTIRNHYSAAKLYRN
jgi:hypothetical protein